MSDNYDLFNKHYESQQLKLKKFPRCTNCGHYIQDDYYFEIDGDYFCEECMIENYRKDVGDYVESNIIY